MSITDTNKKNFIVIYSENKKDLSYNYVKTKINIKTTIPDIIDISNNCYKFQNKIFGKDNLSDDIFKNRVIFSSKLKNDKSPISLLTQQNLFHNIKFIHKNNDFTKPRLLFTKYNITNNIINNNQYLFTPNQGSTILMSEINLNNNDNVLNLLNQSFGNLQFNKLCYFYNIYKAFNNSDYYKFRFSDFINQSNLLDNEKVNIENIDISNDFFSNDLINYDRSNFTTLFKSDSNNSNLSKLDLNTNYDISNNIFLYNKLNNISTIKLNLFKNSNYTNDRPINFIVNKSHDIFSNNYGKIYLSNKFIYLNTRVLDYNSNFYTNNSCYEDATNSCKIYLSLGKSITGITQKNLLTNIKIDFLNNPSENILSGLNNVRNTITKLGNISKIHFTSNSNSNSNSSLPNYLIEKDYDYNYINILYYDIIFSSAKNVDLDLKKFYYNYDISNIAENIYKHRFKSLALLNNITDISYIKTNNQFNIKNIIDISYSKLQNKIKFNTKGIDSINFPLLVSNNILNYDFRFNYNSIFDVDIFFTLKYNYISENIDLSFSILKDYSSNLLLNFHKIKLTSRFFTNVASDFTNVDCVFIYYDPYSDKTPAKFRYPNNNIDICNNANIGIDTLSKAIELLPGSNSSITNTAFIPAKNGSNLSRKMIQGLIGINNIPALLSIEPYDENFIVGRGFLNQYQIENECKTNAEKVENKFNSQKHISVKNPLSNNLNLNKVPKTRNFANIVKNRKLNQKISNAQNCRPDLSNIQNYTTPFTNPLWRRR